MRFTRPYDEVQTVPTSDTRRDHARDRSGYASATTDKEWARVLPRLPKEKAGGRPREHDLRRIVDGIFYLLRSGCQRDMLPKDFPPPIPSNGERYIVTSAIGAGMGSGLVFMILCIAISVILKVVRKAVRSLGGFAIVDGRSVETGPDAGEMAGFDAGKKVKGRKRHIVADTPGMMLNVKVHGVDPRDRDGPALACEWLVRRFPFIEKICADGVYRGAGCPQKRPTAIGDHKARSERFRSLAETMDR